MSERVDDWQSEPKVLTLDIETSIPIVATFGVNKTTFIPVSSVLEHSRVLCVGYKWYHEPRAKVVEGYSEVDHPRMLAEVWKLMDQADVIVGFNHKRFDLPILRGEFRSVLGWEMPSPSDPLDLYTEAKRVYRFDSASLNTLAERVLDDVKMTTGGQSLWVDVWRGCPKAQRKMTRYCRKDVELTEQVFRTIRGDIRTPNAMLYGQGCPTLGCAGRAGDLIIRGYARKQTRVYKRLQCKVCRKYTRQPASVAGVERVETA